MTMWAQNVHTIWKICSFFDAFVSSVCSFFLDVIRSLAQSLLLVRRFVWLFCELSLYLSNYISDRNKSLFLNFSATVSCNIKHIRSDQAEFFSLFSRKKNSQEYFMLLQRYTAFVVSFKTDTTYYMARKQQRKLIATNFSCFLVVIHTFLFISFFRSVLACKPRTDTVGFQFGCYFTSTEIKFTNGSHWIIMRFILMFMQWRNNPIVFALKIFEIFFSYSE